MSLEFVTLHCPYCGEAFESAVDLSAGSSSYTEDCAVCCRPIVVTARVDDSDQLEELTTRREQD
jgi:hypothetical protein